MTYNSKRMAQILTYRRPHGSLTVEEFIADVFDTYDYRLWTSPTGVPLALTISVGNGDSKTLFSSHLDTVHRTPGKQVIGWDEETSLFYKPESKTDDQCLGADDGAGVWLMLEMIDEGVVGEYIFHYGEERGGVGSTGMVDFFPDYLKTFSRAIAFDRRGNNSVITHQGWGRCCSDTFGDALADALNSVSKLVMRNDETGIFTDTANYIELIPECTNLSCGYEAEHTKGETLDFEFLSQLRDACLLIDWEALPTERVAERIEIPSYWSRGGSYGSTCDLDGLRNMRYSELLKWVKKNAADPELIADLMYDAFDQMAYAEERVEYLEVDELSTGGSVWGDPDEDRLNVGMM